MGRNAKYYRKQQLLKELEASNPENIIHPEERLLSVTGFKSLRARRLYITDYPCFPTEHVAYPSGYKIFLPSSINGNQIYGHEAYYSKTSDGEDALTYMPGVNLWGNGTKWNTSVHEYIPGPGPGDFMQQFESEADAIISIIKYFFEPNPHVKAANEARR